MMQKAYNAYINKPNNFSSNQIMVKINMFIQVYISQVKVTLRFLNKFSGMPNAAVYPLSRKQKDCFKSPIAEAKYRIIHITLKNTNSFIVLCMVGDGLPSSFFLFCLKT